MNRLMLCALAWFGCGGTVPTPPPPPALQIQPALYMNTTLVDFEEDEVLALDLAPDAPDYVLYFGVRAQNLLTNQATLRVRMLNAMGQSQAEGLQVLTFPPPSQRSGPWAIPSPAAPVMLRACSSAISKAVENEYLTFEFALTEDKGGRTTKVERHAVPACRYSKAMDQIRCHKACSL